ncbi:anti-sigma factor [Nocardioides sp. DS6]|uniref:Anti-sigma factor n=1 Tax=Nocardioides eburneus TaxID=3231482 RepID=A0ABV3T3W1_9ACTN
MPMTGSDELPDRSDVELRLPAQGVYVSVLRTTTAGLAARLDFTLDDIEDLRMAVGEAAALVLEAASPESDLQARFWLGDRVITVTVDAAVDGPVSVDEDSFAWQVLTTLATSAEVTNTAGRLAITLVVQATPLEAAL